MDAVQHALARARALRDALTRGPAADALLAATVAQGFSPEVAAAGLAAELESWQDEALAELLGEVSSERWPSAVLILAARTLPASAMRQVYLARALGARVHLKAASGQEALGEALAMADAMVAPAVFGSDDEAALLREVARVDTVVVLGSDETVAAVARHTQGKGFAGHGHKVSAAIVARTPTSQEIEGLAADVLAWDQAGCLAPQVVWSATPVARDLADAIAELERRLPLSADKRLAHLNARREMKTLATMIGEEVFTTEAAVVATHPEAALRVATGPRCVWVLPWDEAALRQAKPALSSVAVVGELGPLEGVRICAPGELQRPPLSWRQDGFHPLGSLLQSG